MHENGGWGIKRLLGDALLAVLLFYSTWIDPILGTLTIIGLTLFLLLSFFILKWRSMNLGAKLFKVIEQMAPLTSAYMQGAYRANFHFFKYTQSSQRLSILSASFGLLLLANIPLVGIRGYLRSDWNYLVPAILSLVGYLANAHISQKLNYPLSWLTGFGAIVPSNPKFFSTHLQLAVCVVTLNNVFGIGHLNEPYEGMVSKLLSETERFKMWQVCVKLLPSYNRITERVGFEYVPTFLDEEYKIYSSS